MCYPASDDIILYQHMCDITFDQSPHSIFVCCQALVVFLNLVFSEFLRWSFRLLKQRAKKVVSDSTGLVDFAIWLVNSVFNLLDGQVMFLEEFE